MKNEQSGEQQIEEKGRLYCFPSFLNTGPRNEKK